MAFAVTGGTGFIGRQLVDWLRRDDREVSLIARGRQPRPDRVRDDDGVTYHRSDLEGIDRLTEIFESCSGVAHLAGINHERGEQTYSAVHRRGTHNVVVAAERAGIKRLVLTSYLRARAHRRSGYLDSKWEAEERVRTADLEWCVLKPAGVFGPGDQFLTGLARWIRTVPLVPTVGVTDPELRPVAVEDVVRVIDAALREDRLSGTTLPLLGPTPVTVRGLASLIGQVVGRRPLVIPTPVLSQRIAATAFERLLDPPLVTRAGVRMLAEGMTEPAPAAVCDPVPDDLRPDTALDHAAVDRAIAGTERYGLADVRLF